MPIVQFKEILWLMPLGPEFIPYKKRQSTILALGKKYNVPSFYMALRALTVTWPYKIDINESDSLSMYFCNSS